MTGCRLTPDYLATHATPEIAAHIARQAETIVHLSRRAELAERQVRDQHLTIASQQRMIAELRSRGDRR